jgi:hypothetical protein
MNNEKIMKIICICLACLLMISSLSNIIFSNSKAEKIIEKHKESISTLEKISEKEEEWRTLETEINILRKNLSEKETEKEEIEKTIQGLRRSLVK